MYSEGHKGAAKRAERPEVRLVLYCNPGEYDGMDVLKEDGAGCGKVCCGYSKRWGAVVVDRLSLYIWQLWAG